MATAFEKVMDGRKELVEKVIRLMEEGYHNNRPAWDRLAFYPHNPESGSVYKGGNRLRLMVAGMEAGYADPRWMTFKQMEKAGYHLKTGQHGVMCEKWIFKEKRKAEQEDGTQKTVEVELEKPKVAFFYVYNAEQVQDYPELKKNDLDPDLTKLADDLIRSSECPVYELVQDNAFYQKGQDHIVLPLRGMFKDAGSFIATLIHEMGHSTGHASRLNRTFGMRFGDPDYAKEELRAELGALFTETDLGVDPSAEVLEDHSDYLKSWIGALRDDPNGPEREAAYCLDNDQYLYIQVCDTGYDYTLFAHTGELIDGGQLDAPALSMEEARKEICEMQDLSPGLIEKVPVNMIEGFQEDAALHIPSSIEAEKLPAQEKNVRRIKM